MASHWFEMLVDLPIVADFGLRLTAVLLVTWLLHRLLARGNPRWRVLLWRCAAAGIVLVPVLVWGMPKVPVAIEPAPFGPSEPMPPMDFSDSLPRMGYGGGEEMTPSEAMSQANIEWPEESLSESSPDVAAWYEGWTWLSLGAWLWVGWLLGATALAVRWCMAQVAVRKRILLAREAPDRCQELLQRIASRSGRSAPVRLLMADDLDVPFVAGIRRGVIVLPSRMCGAAYAHELSGILAHELAHHQARDLAWMTLLQWLQILCWVHPLAWRIGSAYALACEEVADVAAARLVGDVQDYSGTLARVALSAYAVPPLAAAIPMASGPEIMTRLHRLKRSLQFVPLSRRIVCGSVAAGILGLMGLAGFEFVYAAAEQVGEDGSRVLQFPADRSVGRLWIATAEEPAWKVSQRAVDYHPHWDWVYLSNAKGPVKVPPRAKVKIKLNASGTWDMSWTSRLAPDALHTVEIVGPPWGGAPFGRTRLQPLSRLTRLQVLELMVVQVSDRDLQAIEPLQSLKMLTLNTPSIGEEGLKSLGRLRSLEGLGLLTKDRCHNPGLAHLSGMKSLREFTFTSTSVSPAGLAHVASLPSLIYVWSGEGFSDEHLMALKAAKSLRGLRIQMSSVTDAGLRHLKDMKDLEYLDLWMTRVSDAGIVHLKSLPALRRLNVRTASNNGKPLITVRGVAQLAEIPSLKQLDLPNFAMTDECCRHVARLASLKHLWIGSSTQNPMTDEGLKQLVGLAGLESLTAAGTGITDAGISRIAQLKNLKRLNLMTVSGISDTGLAAIGGLKQLESLEMGSVGGATMAGVNQLNGLSNLRVLRIGLPKRAYRDEVALDISNLTQLKRLNVNQACEGDLACLTQMKQLEELLIGGYEVGDEGAAHIARLSSLTRVAIGGPKMTDKGLASLAGLTNLSDLTVRGEFSDKGLAHLTPLKGLEILRFQSTLPVSLKVKEGLRKELPNLQSVSMDDRRVSPPPKRSRKLGHKAPAFQAVALDGKHINLADYKGKVLVLYFWSTSCKPCLASTEGLKKNYEDTRAKHADFEMIGLSLDADDQRIAQHVAEYGVPWPQVRIGENSKIAAEYGVSGVPHYVLVDRTGVIRQEGRMDQEFADRLNGLLGPPTAQAVGGRRMWTDETGKHQTEAELLDVQDGKARLKKASGKVISVPLAKLSKADQEFIDRTDRSNRHRKQ